MKKRKSIVLCIIAVALLLISIVGIVHSCQNWGTTQASGGMILDYNAEPYVPSDSLVSDSAKGIDIPGYGDVYFEAEETTVQLTLYNPAQNNCLFRFELYIDDNTEPIASTNLIESGKAVHTVTLSKPLQEGEYTLNIKVMTYTVEDHTALNNALVRAKLHVLG